MFGCLSLVFDILFYYIVEYLVYVIGYSIIFRRYFIRVDQRIVFIIPFYALLLLLSNLSPIPLDLPFGIIIGFLSVLLIFIITSINVREYGFVVIGMPLLISYSLLYIIPFIVSGCENYSSICIALKSTNIFLNTIFISLGLFLSILVASFIYVCRYLETLYCKVFVATSIVYLVSPYVNLIPGVSGSWILSPLATLAFTIVVYILGNWIGNYLFYELSIEKIFDKYVSINILSVLLVLSLALTIRYVGFP